MAASKSTKRRKVRVAPFTDHLVRRTKPKPNGAPNEFGEAASVARGLRLRVSKTAKNWWLALWDGRSKRLHPHPKRRRNPPPPIPRNSLASRPTEHPFPRNGTRPGAAASNLDRAEIRP